MKMDRQFGSLSEGKVADIIIDDDNPLQSITNIRKISLVIKDGIIYNPIQLHRMVGFSK
jgi:imidazolonepropionase-like amidohydrolase